jgi:hypothetical protein
MLKRLEFPQGGSLIILSQWAEAVLFDSPDKVKKVARNDAVAGRPCK